MYKTVRQGENSLQYTILPQTEEVLTNSGVKGKGRDYSPSSHARRLNKRLMVYYSIVSLLAILLVLGMVFFALVVGGAISFDLPPNASPLKHQVETKTTTPCTTTVQPDRSPTRKKELARDMKLLHETSTYKPTSKSELDTNSTTVKIETAIAASTPTTVASPSTPTEYLILKKLQSSATTAFASMEPNKVTTIKPKLSSPYIRQRENNGDLMLGHDINYDRDYEDDDDEDYDVTNPGVESTTPKIATPTSEYVLRSTKNTLPTTTILPEVIETPKIMLSNKTKAKIDKYMEMKERILDDDDEEYKEPLTDEDDVAVHPGTDDVKMSHAKSSWIQNQWPFVDPSSYFQWTGYSARDNLLLPAILSAALSALLVLAILCYALRRRQRCKRRIQEIGNLTSDLQAEDNATLLTAENPSEED